MYCAYLIFLINLVVFHLCKHIRNNGPSKDAFSEFVLKYNRQYETTEEYYYRKMIFEDNLSIIEEHNAKISTYKLGINEFADLTQTEFIKIHHINTDRSDSRRNRDKIREMNFHNVIQNNNSQLTINDTLFTVPDAWDWVSLGGVTKVMSEGACISNYAISAIGGVEGAYYTKYNVLEEFSTQQVVDCSYSYGAGGCSGGLIRDALEYIRDMGICLESEYPYQGKPDKCIKACKIGVKPIGWEVLAYGDNELQRSIYFRPTSVSINILPLRFYSSGIFNGDCDYTDLNHAVLGVSYGVDTISIDDDDSNNNNNDKTNINSMKYFKFKNSWGSKWGENGYFRIVRGEGNLYGKCGCSTDNYFAKF